MAFNGSAKYTGIPKCIYDNKKMLRSGNVHLVMNIFNFLKGPWHSLAMPVSNYPKEFLVTAHTWPVLNRQPTCGYSALEVKRV